MPFISNEILLLIIAQSQRDDLESLGYLLSALFQGSLPWDYNPWEIWRIKMSTPGSTLFRDMDPSFLEYWKDVRSLAFGEVPDYSFLRSRFVQCWERKGFGDTPGEYDWISLFRRLDDGQKEKKKQLDNAPEVPPISVAPSVIAVDDGQEKTKLPDNAPEIPPTSVAPSMIAVDDGQEKTIPLDNAPEIPPISVAPSIIAVNDGQEKAISLDNTPEIPPISVAPSVITVDDGQEKTNPLDNAPEDPPISVAPSMIAVDDGQEKTMLPENAPEIPPIPVAPSMISPGNSSHSAH